jgi:hypothetical protein
MSYETLASLNEFGFIKKVYTNNNGFDAEKNMYRV